MMVFVTEQEEQQEQQERRNWPMMNALIFTIRHDCEAIFRTGRVRKGGIYGEAYAVSMRPK